MKREGLNHRLPLADFDVEVRLPRDLTEAEAARLAEWISALVSPWAAPPPAKEETPGACLACGGVGDLMNKNGRKSRCQACGGTGRAGRGTP